MALTDFLSDETQGPGTGFVYASKPVDWAAEMEDTEIGKICLIPKLFDRIH